MSAALGFDPHAYLRARREQQDRDALAAELQRRADRAFAVLSHIAEHGHDGGTDEPFVEWEN